MLWRCWDIFKLFPTTNLSYTWWRPVSISKFSPLYVMYFMCFMLWLCGGGLLFYAISKYKSALYVVGAFVYKHIFTFFKLRLRYLLWYGGGLCLWSKILPPVMMLELTLFVISKYKFSLSVVGARVFKYRFNTWFYKQTCCMFWWCAGLFILRYFQIQICPVRYGGLCL